MVLSQRHTLPLSHCHREGLPGGVKERKQQRLNVGEAIHESLCFSPSGNLYITERGPALMEPAFKCGQIPSLLIIACGMAVTTHGQLRLALGLRGWQN